jgi:hypothetical protein
LVLAGSSPTSKGLPESIIANVAGKLLLLQRDHSVPERKGKQVSVVKQQQVLWFMNCCLLDTVSCTSGAGIMR